MTSHPSTFRERFAEIFQELEERGYGPEWQSVAEETNWLPTGRFSTAELIRCVRGPILTVALSSKTVVTAADSISTSFRMDTALCFKVRTNWSKRWVPGLHLLSIHLDSNNCWFGNDLGLGIIAHLNAISHLEIHLPKAKVKVRVCPPYNEEKGDWEELNKHHIADHEIEIVSPGHPRTWHENDAFPEDDAVPQVSWLVPPAHSMAGIISLAQLLLAEPPYLPPHTAPPKVTSVPAPHIRYLWWTGYPIAAVAFFLGGLVSVSWGWSRHSAGWMVFLGIVLLIVAIVVVLVALERLDKIRRGCVELVGTLERKWVSPDHAIIQAGTHLSPKIPQYDELSEDETVRFIRVEGLPFIVEESQHRELSEGDRIIIKYWPGNKRVVSTGISQMD